MSRTRRVYNKIRKNLHRGTYDIFDFYRPYGEICCGNCNHCKDHKRDQKLRTLKSREFEKLLIDEGQL